MTGAASATVGQGYVELRGWKAIADFLGIGVSTAIRHADEHGMPVHVWGTRNVLGYADALTEWRRSRVKPRLPRSARKLQAAAVAA